MSSRVVYKSFWEFIFILKTIPIYYQGSLMWEDNPLELKLGVKDSFDNHHYISIFNFKRTIDDRDDYIRVCNLIGRKPVELYDWKDECRKIKNTISTRDGKYSLLFSLTVSSRVHLSLFD